MPACLLACNSTTTGILVEFEKKHRNSVSIKMEMDQERARALFETGAILLFLDVPLGTLFGIDYNCWRTGERFRGVKLIPPGQHFVYFNSIEQRDASIVGERKGFFHCFRSREILVKKWSPALESFDPDYVCADEELERLRAGKQDLDRFLGAYPYENYKRWFALTSHLDEASLHKLLPETGLVTSSSTLVGQEFRSERKPAATATEQGAELAAISEEVDMGGEMIDTKSGFRLKEKGLFRMPASLAEAEQMIPKMSELRATSIRFSRLPIGANFPTASSASEITRHSMDFTFRLKNLLEHGRELYQPAPDAMDAERAATTPDQLLAELQFAFVLFLVGNNYEGFEQWKFLLHLLCNSEQFIAEQPALYFKLINVIYHQLKEMPDDFFTDLETQNNFVCMNLHSLFEIVGELGTGLVRQDSQAPATNAPAIMRLSKKAAEFKEYLRERFNFDFDQELDEYAPTIVDADQPF